MAAWSALQAGREGSAATSWVLGAGFVGGMVAGLSLLGPAPLIGATLVVTSFGALAVPKFVRGRRVRRAQDELLVATGFLRAADRRDATRALIQLWQDAQTRARLTTLHPSLIQAFNDAAIVADGEPSVFEVFAQILEPSDVPDAFTDRVTAFVSEREQFPAYTIGTPTFGPTVVRPLAFVVFALARMEAPPALLLEARKADTAASRPLPDDRATGSRMGLMLHNDDYTPFELVVELLVDHAGATLEEARAATVAVDLEGAALLRTGAPDDLRQLADALVAGAEAAASPLRATVVTVDDDAPVFL